MFERLDSDARHILELAQHEARALDHHYVGTEHVLLALTLAAGEPAELLTARGCDPDVIRDEIAAVIGAGSQRGPSPETLLATLGIDLAEVRSRVEATFGTDAVSGAAVATRPRRRFHGRWWWLNCTAGQPSTLASGHRYGLAPRLKKVIDIAATDSTPAADTPLHLLAAILQEGQGVACQILTRRAVDITALAAAARARLA